MDELRERLATALGPDYELGPELGRGGMGVVYRATDRRLQRDVAIKVLPPELSFRNELRDRFVFEAQLAAGLNHPNIVPIFDVGDREGLVWYVMALVDGESARVKVQRDGPLTSAQTRRILREVAWALAYAHARGIVHRDIKPDNILLEQETGRALVTDFGIAKLAETETPVGATQPGMVLGSLMYMAPEQASGDAEIDGRADLYSLGLTAYFLLSGRPPFERATPVTVAARIATAATPNWNAIDPPVDPALQALLERCVAVDAKERWGDAEEILEDLGPQALAPRPMPASIRRLVRDFMLIPTLGLIVLVIDVLAESPGTGEFVAWLALIIFVNFGVTLRAFTKRHFRWPDLRDGLEMEFARQAEEFEATGHLKQRFSAIVHLATFAAIGVSLGAIPIVEGLQPVVPLTALFLLLSGLLTVPVAWLQIKVYTFFGRLGLKLLPSLPRPEGDGWFSRFADRLLTKLFRPVRIGAAARDRLPPPGAAHPDTTSTSGWRTSEVGAARRSASSIEDLFARLPREARHSSRQARIVARDLTAAIDDLRRERSALERTRERELESLAATSRHAALALEHVRAALEALTRGDGSQADVDAALARAQTILSRHDPGRDAAQPKTKRRLTASNWLGVQLDASVTGKSPYDGGEADSAPALTREVTARWDRHADLRRQLPDRADRDVRAFLHRVGEMESALSLRTQRGLAVDAAAAESVTQCERALGRLLDALDRYEAGRGGTTEIEALLDHIRDIGSHIDDPHDD